MFFLKWFLIILAVIVLGRFSVRFLIWIGTELLMTSAGEEKEKEKHVEQESDPELMARLNSLAMHGPDPYLF